MEGRPEFPAAARNAAERGSISSCMAQLELFFDCVSPFSCRAGCARPALPALELGGFPARHAAPFHVGGDLFFGNDRLLFVEEALHA